MKPITLPDDLRQEYPFSTDPDSFVKLPIPNTNAYMHVVDEGSSDVPVVMLHGNPTWSFFYRNIIKGLSPRVRCIAPDHLGFGLSSKPQDPSLYTLTQHSKNLHFLLDHLNIKKFHLVVHDWGGPIGLLTALDRLDSLQSLTILNTAAFDVHKISKRILFLHSFPKLGSFLMRRLNLFAYPATFMSVDLPLSSTIKQGFLFPYNNYNNRIAIDSAVKDIPYSSDHPTRKAIEHIEANLHKFQSVPTQIIWGGKDFCFHEHYYNGWIQRLPHASAHYMEHAGHYLLEDDPDHCFRLISDWINPS